MNVYRYLRLLLPLLMTAGVVTLFAPRFERNFGGEALIFVASKIASAQQEVALSESEVQRDKSRILVLLPKAQQLYLRADFILPKSRSEEDHLLHIERIAGNFELSLNGALLAENRPLHWYLWGRLFDSRFILPSKLLQTGSNQLAFRFDARPIEMVAYVHRPEIRLLKAQDAVHAHRIDWFSSFNAAGAFMLAALLGGIFLRRQAAHEYLYFALGMVGWGVYSQILSERVYLLSTTWNQLLLHWALAIFVWGMSRFARRYCADRNAQREAWVDRMTLYPAALLLIAALVLPTFTFLEWPLQIHRLLLIGIGLEMTIVFVRFCWRNRLPAADLMVSAQIGALILGLHDALIYATLVNFGYNSLIAYGLPVPLFIFGYILAERFTQSLAEAETLNRELDARVMQKTCELESAQHERELLLQSQTLSAERERLMRDVHDGVGGQLVSLLAQADRGQLHAGNVREALAASLTDLRFIIDSLDEVGSDPLIALGMFRQRVQPQITRAGLHCSFATNTLPEGLILPPETLLQCFRILQEAIQNTIKHACASSVAVTAHYTQDQAAGRIEISVRDDGVGGAQAASGRGLRNMEVRAEQIGARLNIDSDASGTCVTLALPARS